MLNEFFNELANNPSSKQPGFDFYLAWGNHNLNSVLSTADAHGVLGRTLVYFNCEVLPLLKGVSEVNPTVNLIVGLLNPPTKAQCQSTGILKATAGASGAKGLPSAPGGGLLSGLRPQGFGQPAAARGGEG